MMVRIDTKKKKKKKRKKGKDRKMFACGSFKENCSLLHHRNSAP